jgi:hypothetical protein
VDVLRGDIAVNEPERHAAFARCIVRRMKTFERGAHDGADVARRHALARLACLPNEPRERLSGDILHHEKELFAVLDDVERRDDVRMTYADREARLVEEHADEIGILREVGMQPLDRDRSRETDGADEARDMDRGHAAGRDFAVQRVPTQTSAIVRAAGLFRHLHLVSNVTRRV